MFSPNYICVLLCLSVLIHCTIGELGNDKLNYQSTENIRYEETTLDDKDNMEVEYTSKAKADQDLYIKNLISDFVRNIESKLLKLEEKVVEKIENYIDFKFETSNIENHSALENTNQLEKKIHNFEENQYRRLDVLEIKNESSLKKKISEFEAVMNRTLDSLKNVSNCKEQLAGFNNQMYSVIKNYENMLTTYKTNTTDRDFCNKMMNTTNEPKDHVVIDPIEDKIQAENISYSKMNSSELLDGFTDRCKEVFSFGYKWKAYKLNSSEFKNTIVKKNKTGVSYFEMHIAIKAERDGIIVLSPVTHPKVNTPVFEIAIGVMNNKRTDLRLTVGDGSNAVIIDTDDILSFYKYKTFYIKISDGNLKFGMEGNPPLISHDNPGLSAVEYIFFTTWNFNHARFLIDCPKPY